MIRSERPRIVLGRGPRACERALIETVSRELESAPAQLLARPLYLLVPSHSLRDHILERLVSRGRGRAGLGCFTLRGLALDLLERCGESPPPGGWMLPILVRRAARRHPSLRSTLDHLRDGYASLVGPVVDLLEAGLEPVHGEAIDEALAEEGRLAASVAEVKRARSLVEVAIQVREEMDSLNLGHVSALLHRAAEVLRTRSDLEFPCSGIHVFGFADATGVATDLIEAALLRFGGAVYLDHPPDPTAPETEDPSFEFSRRFATRLADLGQQDPHSVELTERADIQLISALGVEAEVREVGWRIGELLDGGERPERIGVVARRLEPYRTALRTHFDRLGIPYTAPRTSGPLLPQGRRVRALLEVLARGGRCRIDRWLDARPAGKTTVPDSDLRLALFGLGVSRIDELAQLQREDVLQRESYPLPVRLGYLDADTEGARLARRHIPTTALRGVQEQAKHIQQLFEAWSGRHPWSVHRESLDLLLSQLCWSVPDPVLADVHKAVDRLALGIPGSMELDLDEFARALADSLGAVGLDRFGGVGGGVQILDVTEARGRTFKHLFVLGMNKGVFPRNVREDPALRDDLRRVLGREGHGVLPDLTLKRAGFAEERFLFAQLCSASPKVTLSWQIADEDNRELSCSPLVERFLWTRESVRVSSPLTVDPALEQTSRPRTAVESAIRAALAGEPRQIKAALTLAQPDDLSISPQALTTSRLSSLAELDRPPGDDSRLGPFFGLVGPATDPTEPRLAHGLYVTTLERLAACPWQTFLERVLRLEPLPDPVEILPGIDSFLIGQLVHRVLERLVRRSVNENPATLEEARHATTTTSGWPDATRLRRLVLREAQRLSQDHGIALDGFAEILAQVALPFLDQAEHLMATETEDIHPVAAEMEGSVPIDPVDRERNLHFKADRVDVLGGQLVLSDFKTGRHGISAAKTAKTREKHLLAEIRKGRLLQAAAYVRASGGSEDCGRYVFLHPDFQGVDEARIVAVTAGNEAAGTAFRHAVSLLEHAWQAGVFFPRLVEPEADREPGACEYCGVAEACNRGDSSLRGRLRSWASRNRPQDDGDRALLDIWYLASTKGIPE